MDLDVQRRNVVALSSPLVLILSLLSLSNPISSPTPGFLFRFKVLIAGDHESPHLFIHHPGSL